MKIKIKIICIIGILAIIGLGCFFINGMYGNPISKALVNYNVNQYIGEHYKDLDLVKEKCKYNFKFNEYYVSVQSKHSVDTSFSIYFDSLGKVLHDDHDKIGYNTWDRLDDEIKLKVQEILREEFPDEENKISAHMIDGDRDVLPLDMPLDIKNTPKPIEVTIQTFSDEQTYEKVASIMGIMQEELEEKGVKADEYSVVIIPLKDKVENFSGVSWADALTVFDIPAKLLEEENPANTIKEYNEIQYEDINNE